jgi:hypothetical protein
MSGYKASGTGIRDLTSFVPGQVTPGGEERWAILVVAFARLVNSRPRESFIDPLEDGPAMNLDHDRHAETQRRTLDTEAAIARYYRDFLLGRALPPDDYLAALFDSLERSDATVAYPGPADHAVTARAARH